MPDDDKKAPTEAEQFAGETDGFRKAGSDAPVVADKKADEPKGQEKPAADAKKEPDAAKGDEAKAAADDEAKAKEIEADGKPAEDDDKLTDPLAKRLARAESKGRRSATTEAEDKIAAAEARAKDAEDKLAAKEKAVELGPKPRVDDFDTLDEYETARDKWVIADHERKAAPAEKKEPETKAEPAKKADADLPLGITSGDLRASLEDLNENLPPSVVSRLKDDKVVPILPAPVMLEISDEDDKDRKAAMARFVIGHPKTMAAINKLPARSQAAQFVRLFSESSPTVTKKVSDAPKPIERVNGAGASGLVDTLSKSSFRDFNETVDKIEAEDRKHGRA